MGIRSKEELGKRLSATQVARHLGLECERSSQAL